MADENKRKTDYHLMLFIDKQDGMINQMGIGRRFIEVVAGIIVLILAVTIAGWVITANKKNDLVLQNVTLTAKIDEMQTKLDELTAENTELNNKVTILSDTVNTKVEEVTAIQEEADAAHYPEGFPLSSSASMKEDEDKPNSLIFTCNSGSSIIATGAGKVLEVVPDTEYGYCIRIDHDNGYVTEYYTSATPLIKEGDDVLQGAILALVDSNDSKLLYKIYKDEAEVDPMTVIKIDG